MFLDEQAEEKSCKTNKLFNQFFFVGFFSFRVGDAAGDEENQEQNYFKETDTVTRRSPAEGSKPGFLSRHALPCRYF